MSLNKKIKLGGGVLFVLVLAIWGIFYLHSARSIQSANAAHLRQVSAQILDRLERELLELETLAFSLSEHAAVRDLVAEPNAIRFHEKSAGVDTLIAALAGVSELSPDIVIYSSGHGGGDAWANFAGNKGHAAGSTLKKAFDATSVPRYKAIALEGVRYIGYARTVDTHNGLVVLLVEEARLLGSFSGYAVTDDLVISLAEEGTIVATSDPALLGQATEQVDTDAALAQRRKVGFAPFEVLVSADASTLAGIGRDYALAALLTVALLLGLLIVVSRTANRHLFRPMLHVMQEVKALGNTGQAPDGLSPTGEADFDALVDQVNQMLARLEEEGQVLLNTQTQLQQAEIERQQALIVSLKKQINAHFTVNILNDITVLAEQGETEKAAEVAEGLSHLLRYANAEDAFADGMEELFVLEKYAAIMGIRYGHAFSAEFDWDDRLGRAKMPRMLLQPLVENAIVHGLGHRPVGGAVKVTAQLQDERILVLVEDNGIGMPKPTLERLTYRITAADTPDWAAAGVQHIALANIRRRLRSYYPDAFEFTVESTMGAGTTVRLAFPVHPAPETEKAGPENGRAWPNKAER